jgi:hypothetical protein
VEITTSLSFVETMIYDYDIPECCSLTPGKQMYVDPRSGVRSLLLASSGGTPPLLHSTNGAPFAAAPTWRGKRYNVPLTNRCSVGDKNGLTVVLRMILRMTQTSKLIGVRPLGPTPMECY